MSDAANQETRGFQTEVKQLMQLMINSLYSNKEIFLRELVSNASDAADKVRFEALENPELLEDDADLGIDIEFDTDARTLTVSDNGIGMSREELIANLGTIARSGTAEFLQQMTGDQKTDSQLIGQFGVGFYSAFIVADRVEVYSRRAGLPPEQGVHWESAGEGEFTVADANVERRGTRVILHLKEAEAEFSEAARLEALIRKYSDHIGLPVTLTKHGETEHKSVNSAAALWTLSRSEINDEEYVEFYKHISHDFEDPLTWSHNRVEGKREYTSLLYIPKRAPFDLWNREAPRGLKLYVQRVYIMDQAEQFLPLYLRFVKGVIDTNDLPLNISRELLQQSPDLTAIRNALTRRVLDMLAKMATIAKDNDDDDGDNDGDDYAVFWEQFGQVLKEGIIEDPQNAKRIAKLLRFTTTQSSADKQDQSLADYVSRAQEKQDTIYYVAADNLSAAKASPHLEQLRAQKLEALLLHDRIDAWVMDHLTEFDGKTLQDIGRGQLKLPDQDSDDDSQSEKNKEHAALLDKIKATLVDQVEAVNVSQRLVESPACLVASADDMGAQMRRMLEMAGQALPESKPALEINVEHPLVLRLQSESQDERFADLSRILFDHALLAEGGQLKDPGDYLRRMNAVLVDLPAAAD